MITIDHAVQPEITALRPIGDPLVVIHATLKARQADGQSLTDLAKRWKLNRGLLVWFERHGGQRWSQTLVEAFASVVGPWQTTLLAYPPEEDNPPAYVLAQYAPRQCPVSDVWFVPGAPHAVYAPHVPASLRRCYRRTPALARARYHDWFTQQIARQT